MAWKAANRERLAVALNNLGECDRLQGDYASARRQYEEVLPIVKSLGKQPSVCTATVNLGFVAAAMGATSEAEGYFMDSLRLASEIKSATNILTSLLGIALVRALRDDPAQAASLLGLVLHHPSVDADVKTDAEPILAKIRGHLSPEEFERAMEAGKALDLDQVVAELLRSGSEKS